ncbi:MAG: hypothetical protein KAQ78_01840, partial [Candidatus Latescibacteria bacterium]|nr:hypothetical protein [Candidatus Latescibacterota bacterium]
TGDGEEKGEIGIALAQAFSYQRSAFSRPTGCRVPPDVRYAFAGVKDRPGKGRGKLTADS